MPISPIVQQHQQSIIQQNITPGQLTFNKEFGVAAYDLLGAKFPRILPFVVTFKVLDQGPSAEEGSGVGTFIVSRGKDVEYVPVVIHDGSIVSCEMIYNKEDDAFSPLIPKEVKSIVSANMTQDHSLVNNPSVEDTQQVFKNMFRPPMSSRPVLAASTSLLESLPDDAKKALSTYLTGNPTLFAKIATFYPIELLATKLATGSAKEKVATEQALEQYQYLDRVLRLEDLTKEAASILAADTRAEILAKGYTINKVPENPAGVIAHTKLASDVESVFNATQVQKESGLKGSGYLLSLKGSDFQGTYCVIQDELILTAEGRFIIPSNGLVVSNFKPGINIDTLNKVKPFSPVSTQSLTAALEDDHTSLLVASPTRQGDLKVYAQSPGKCLAMDIEGVIWAEGREGTVSFTPVLQRGRVDGGENIYIYPLNSWIATTNWCSNSAGQFIKTLQDLVSLVKKTTIPLQVQIDGPDWHLIDRRLDTTTKFKSEPELVNYLVTNYAFDKEAADTILEHKKVYLMKHAYTLPMGSSEHPSGGMWGQTQGGTGQIPTGMEGQLGGAMDPRVIDESMVEDMAEFEDPDMLDTGLIGSLAHADDIKALLVDSAQEFEGTVTELGKSILLFAINQKEMEDQYGREDYSSVVHSLRTGFSTLGGLVYDLKEYTNNQSYRAAEA